MNNIKNKVTLLNVLSSLLLQIFNIVSAFIIPRIILSYFGSEVNGLVSSLTQFLSYITLVEGGVTGVITASLYKPLVNKDFEKVSSIVKTSNSFFRKIGLLFIGYSLIVALIYPLFFNKLFSFIYIFSLTLILAIDLLIQYMYSLTLRTLLIADKKVYVVSFTRIVTIILNVVVVIISVKVYPSIHLLKFVGGLLFILQPLIYTWYIKKNYLINYNAKIDNNLLSERWNGFAINVAAFIHYSTDITILTIFTNLSTVSIYSVYALVTSGIRSIINSISTGINPTIGQSYASGNMKDLNQKMNIYEFIINILVFFIFSIAGLLITSFVMIYTKGINDADYYQPLFGYLILLSEAIYLIKFPHLNLAYSANKFKEITKPAFVEAAINIIISVILVRKYGLIGISIGTISAMIYRLIFHVSYTKKLIPDRKESVFYKKLFIFCIFSILSIIICVSFIPNVDFNIYKWLFSAIIYVAIFILVYSIMVALFFRDEFIYIKKYLFRKRVK